MMNRSDRRQHTYPAILMVVVATLMFAANGIVSKIVLTTGIDALRLSSLRAAAAAAVMFVFISLLPHRPSLKVRPSEIVAVFVYGIAGFFVVPVAYLIAIERLPIGVALLIEYLAPGIVAVWNVSHGIGNRSWQRVLVALCVSISGLIVVCRPWLAHRLDPYGVACAVLAALALAASFIGGKAALASVNPIALTFWAFGISGLLGMVVRPWRPADLKFLTSVSRGEPTWQFLIFIVLLGTVVPYVLLANGLSRLASTNVAFIGMLEPVAAAGLAWAVLGERLAPIQVVGGLIVLVGVGVAEINQTQ